MTSIQNRSLLKIKNHKTRNCLLALGVVLGNPTSSFALDESLMSLDLATLLDVEVVSASRKPTVLSQNAAAIQVITAQDIELSGATSIPELFRTVTGMQVAQLSANQWAVSIRGMNARYANKLLVLIDGRTVYSPTFSGVYWDVQDTILADIDRIEIIKGPGAALWGANAVNGVINIITKSAAATKGRFIQFGINGPDQYELNLRHGGRIGETDGFWRISAKSFNRAGMVLHETPQIAGDHWNQSRLGYRADISAGPSAFMLTAEAYTGRSGETAVLMNPQLPPPFFKLANTQQRVQGYHLLGRWQYQAQPLYTHTLQAFIDHTEREWPQHNDEIQSTVDLDYQFRNKGFENHDILWGGGLRQINTKIQPGQIYEGALRYSELNKWRYKTSIKSIFFQDDMTLVPNKLTLTVGAKLEKHGNKPSRLMPTTRALFSPAEGTTIWSAYTSAHRAPGHMDDGGTYRFLFPKADPTHPLYPSPLIPFLQLSGKFESEQIEALELGWRQEISKSIRLDTSLYQHDYKKIRTGRLQPQFEVGNGYINLYAEAANGAKIQSTGLEFTAHWQPDHIWRHSLGLAYQNSKLQQPADERSLDTIGSSPRWAWHATSDWRPNSQNSLRLTLRHVGRKPNINHAIALAAYTALDLQYIYQPSPALQFSVGGYNLLGGRRLEAVSDLLDVASSSIRPGLRARATWKF